MLRGLWSGLRALVGGHNDTDWDFLDRRSLIRLRCHYDVELVVNKKKHRGSIIDMSLQGMKLRCFAPVKKNDLVKVTYPKPIIGAEQETIRCKALWVRKRDRDFVTFVGLGYDEDDQTMSRSWVKYLLRQLGFDQNRIFEKRKAVRAECFIPAEVVFGHAKLLDGKLYNLGIGGALVECPKRLEKNTLVELRIGPFEDLEQFSVSGQIVGVRKQGNLYYFGIEFPHELKETTVKNLGKYLIHLLKNHWCD